MQKIIYLFKKSLSDLYKNPIVVLPTFILLVIFAILSGLALDFTNAFNSSSSQMVFIIISSLIAYSIISFLFSSLIGLSGDIIRGKKKNIFVYGKKFWLKNLVIIILILVIRYIVNVSSIFLGVKIGTFLNLSLQSAKILFSLIYATGLLGIIIFFTFSSFYLVLNNLSIIQSVKSSFSLVRKNYFSTLFILLIFAILYTLIGFINLPYLPELLEYIILIPLLSLALSRFLIGK